MQIRDRSGFFLAIVLIGLGVLFLAASIIPGFSIGITWPVIFLFIAAGFYLPPLIWPSVRRELAALFIPGSVMLSLGLIFLYNTATSDWRVWAYAWLLIPAGVGLGLILSSWVGDWSRAATWVGIWLLAVDVALFSLFAALFSKGFLSIVGAVLMVICGFVLLLRAFLRPSGDD